MIEENSTNLQVHFIQSFAYTDWTNILFVTSHIFCILLSIPLNLGIIWYENNVSDNRRTLINKMVAITALYTMLIILAGHHQ